MKRRAKIVATLGPATREPRVLRALLRAGLDAARLNFSHGDHAAHRRMIASLRAAAASEKATIALIADLPGPKIRTGALRGGRAVTLRPGAAIALTSERADGSAERISISYPRLAKDLHAGDRILLSDGLIELRVEGRRRGDLACRVVQGGELREHQGVNLPGATLSISAVTPQDRKHLRFALDQDVDYIAQSFVRDASDIRALKRLIKSAGRNTPVLAKIEKPEALDRLEAILAESDGVMVARGDLGVEMSPESVPPAQKRIIALANRMRLPVIVATQMLESMIVSPRPTRAEASDVANAVLDGADAVMLSGETARGAYPVETIAMMARIIEEAEGVEGRASSRRRRGDQFSVAESIAEAVAHAAENLEMAAIAVFTESGSTARLVSKFRPTPPIIGFSPHAEVRRRLALYWGVTPRAIRASGGVETLIREAERRILETRLARKGDLIGIVAGIPAELHASTNLLKIHRVGG